MDVNDDGGQMKLRVDAHSAVGVLEEVTRSVMSLIDGAGVLGGDALDDGRQRNLSDLKD